MFLKLFLKDHHDAFIELCKKYRVKNMFAFGSSIGDNFNLEKSDIDILVDLYFEDPLEYGEALLNLWNDLESLFGRRVDLLTDSSIKNPYLRKSIDASKILVYDGQRAEVLV